MATPNDLHRAVGFRHCRIYQLDAAGYIKATSHTTPYQGLELTGPKTLEVTKPEPRRISHTGADRVLATDVLPTLESVSAVITASGADFDLEALMNDVTIVTHGEMRLIGQATDKQGNEPQLAVLGFRQSLDGVSGARRWDLIWLPMCRIIPSGHTMNDNPDEKTYNVYPNVVTKWPYGLDFAVGTEGFTEAQYIDGVAEYKPHLVTFSGNGAAVAFTLPVDKQAVSTDKITVYHLVAATGVITDVSGTVTLAVDDVTFGVAPASGDTIFIVYEYA
jgi:hypothetical protein